MKKLNFAIILGILLFVVTSYSAYAAITVTIASPTTGTWSTNSTHFPINFTVTGNWSKYYCTLNSSHGASGWSPWQNQANYDNASLIDVVNNSATFMNITTNSTSTLLNSSKLWSYQVVCLSYLNVTDIGLSTNMTSLGIDFKAPGTFYCSGVTGDDDWVNNTYKTDYAPIFRWNDNQSTSDTNFSFYRLRANYSAIYANLWDYEYNITTNGSRTSVQVNLSNATADRNVQWWVEGFDMAGNGVNASNCSLTQPLFMNIDYTCSHLTLGWNLCGMVDNGPVKAKHICDQIPNCEYVSLYNSTHDFQTYTSGSVPNENLTFGARSVYEINGGLNASVFIYVSANTTWANRTLDADLKEAFYFNFTNGTVYPGSGWNVVPVLNKTQCVNFSKMDHYLNGNGTLSLSLTGGNVSYFAWYNNSNKKSVPFVNNWTINGNLVPHYGEAFWAYFNNETLTNRFLWNSSASVWADGNRNLTEVC